MIFNRNNAIIKLIEHYAWHCDDYSHILRYGFWGFECYSNKELEELCKTNDIPKKDYYDKVKEIA
jgi:hypothetical protein